MTQRVKKTLQIPRAKELRSNKLEDIQNHLEILYAALDKAHRALYQDLKTIQVDDAGWIYFGNKDTDGTWRIGRSGTAWNMERRESGTYTKKGAITA